MLPDTLEVDCLLTRAALLWPDKTAISWSSGDGGLHSTTFLELKEVVERMSHALAGLSDGLRVACLLTNSLPSLVTVLALQAIGKVPVMLNLRLRAEDWEEQCELVGTDLLVHSKALESPNFMRSICVEDLAVASADMGMIEVPRSLDRDALILFTSGSRGAPKAARLRYSNLVASAYQSNLNTLLAEGNSWLLSLPIYHAGGLSILFRCLLAGAEVQLMEGFDREQIVLESRSRRTTHLSLVPTMLEEVLEAREASPFGPDLRALLLGGAASSKKLMEKIRRFDIPVLTSYGMTETASHVTCTSLSDSPDKLVSAGRTLALSKVRVLDERGKELGKNELGRIAVKGACVFAGYIGANEVEEEFLTNDSGYFDESGFLHIQGRIDDIISSGGEKFALAEIEEAALACPGVIRACALKQLNERWGERPVLFVEGRLEPELLLRHLREILPRFKVPDRIVILREIPLTALGKVDHPKLRELLEKEMIS